MTKEAGDDPAGLVGMALDEAVETVVARGDADDPDAAGSALAPLCEDGVVKQSGIDGRLTDVASTVSTAEARVEAASTAFEAARETADGAPDLAVVRSRLDGFEARIRELENRTTGLADDLRPLVARRRDSDALFEVARGLADLSSAADDVHRTADVLANDLEAFERWLTTPDERWEELARDVSAFETSLDELEGSIDALVGALEGTGDEDAVLARAKRSRGVEDLGGLWADLRGDRLMKGLVLKDARAELTDLRTWATRTGDDGDGGVGEVAARLDALDDRLAAIDDRLDGVSRPDWEDRFGDRLAALDDALDAFEPPIDWAEVESSVLEGNAPPTAER